MWEDVRAGGAMIYYLNPTRGLCYTLTLNWRDRVSSIWNRTGHQITMYTRTSCQGIGADVENGEYDGSFVFFNDEMESFWSN